MDDIERASAELDGMFRQRIVPAVVRTDGHVVQAEHKRAQLVVTSIQALTNQLVGRFEARIANARAEVSSVERRTSRSILALLIGAPLLAAGITLHVPAGPKNGVSARRRSASCVVMGPSRHHMGSITATARPSPMPTEAAT